MNACDGGVELILDEDGYYKSRINADKCIDCGRCLDICPYNTLPRQIDEVISYVAYSKNREDVINSSSGGIAYEIAKKYIDKGYVVIGAAWSKDFGRVEHISAFDGIDLLKLKKSKYVQSYTYDGFSQIKEAEKVVVFGTPCQIAGLRNLYGEREGLLLVDFDCMGPAGYNLWKKYLSYLDDLDATGIKSLEMRHKKHSWMRYGTLVEFNDGQQYYKDKFHDPFCVLYHLAHTIQYPCLNECKYKDSSMADLRIGDAWNHVSGFTKSEIHDGLSLVTPLTEKGKSALTSISDEIVLKEVKRTDNISLKITSDSRIVECLRNEESNIEDAICIYNDVSLMRRLIRILSVVLSSNDFVYLSVKSLKKYVGGLLK